MNRLFVVILLLAALLFPLYAAAGQGNVPDAAICLAKQLDEQLMDRYKNGSSCLGRQYEKVDRSNIMIIGTTPANINNLQRASPLARQMTEEITRWLVNRGYRYDEIRKGAAIRFEPRTGEFILTRNVSQLASRSARGQVVLAGTYVLSGEDVRFTMSLICATSNEVLAKATATVPITNDLRPMLVDNYGGGLSPTVYTRLH